MADRIKELKELFKGYRTALGDYLHTKIDLSDFDQAMQEQYRTISIGAAILDTHIPQLREGNPFSIEATLKKDVRTTLKSAYAVINYLQQTPHKTPHDTFMEPAHRMSTIGDELILKLKG